jgi:hypothetical protein
LEQVVLFIGLDLLGAPAGLDDPLPDLLQKSAY